MEDGVLAIFILMTLFGALFFAWGMWIYGEQTLSHSEPAKVIEKTEGYGQCKVKLADGSMMIAGERNCQYKVGDTVKVKISGTNVSII